MNEVKTKSKYQIAYLYNYEQSKWLKVEYKGVPWHIKGWNTLVNEELIQKDIQLKFIKSRAHQEGMGLLTLACNFQSFNFSEQTEHFFMISRKNEVMISQWLLLQG